MIPAAPQVGDIVVILLDPYETGRVEHVGTETTLVVSVRVPAGHVVRVKADEVRVVTRAPQPICPPWCDREHGGFSTVTGQVQVEHKARRGSYELVAAETVDPATGVATVEPAVVLTSDDDAWSAETPAGLAARLRSEARPLLALADLLDNEAL